MIYTKITKDTHQLGISLLESLVALALTSVLCLTLTKLQIRLLHHTKRTYYQEIAIRNQISLTERLKSCLGNTECQQIEIQSWTKALACGTPELAYDQKYVKTILSKIHWNSHKESITLRFNYV